jgi:hypothetical protein
MFCVLIAGIYIEERSPRIFVALVLVGMFAMLDRYLGVAAIATGAVAVTFFVEGRPWQRLGRGLVVCFAALPAGIWWVITSQLYDRREPISFAENFQWFSRSILEWFFPFKVLRPHLDSYINWLWIVVLVLVVAVACTGRNREPGGVPGSRRSSGSFALPLMIFGICYTLALFGSASISYSNKLRGRFLLPVYIPFVTLLAMAAEIPLREADDTKSRATRLLAAGFAYGTLAVAGVLLLRVTGPLVLESHGNGAAGGDNAFNTEAWQDNDAVQYWWSHAPRDPYMLLSNEPDGVAFFSRHATGSVPRKTTGPYGTEQYALSEYTGDLFSSRMDVYILWKEPNFYDYLYTVEELQSIAQVETLFKSDQGGIYRLRPKAGS